MVHKLVLQWLGCKLLVIELLANKLLGIVMVLRLLVLQVLGDGLLVEMMLEILLEMLLEEVLE